MSDQAEGRRWLESAGFILDPKIIEQAARARSWDRREAKKTKRINIALTAIVAVETLAILVQIGSINQMIPLQRILPVFFHTNDGGVMETAITTESLPQRLADSATKTSLWQYVKHRESYSWIEMDDNNKIVQAMSARPVRELYEAWANGKNPDSYMSLYGRRAVIRVELKEINPNDYHPSIAGRPGSIVIHFKRQVFEEGAPPQKAIIYTASIGFIANYKQGFNVLDILEFNPLRIVVTDYPGADRLGGETAG